MIKAGIIGATGYAGNEIVRLLLGHKDVEIKWFGSRSYIDQQYADIYQNFFKLVDAKCMDDNMAALADEVDVIFTATPQGLCASLINEEILSKCKGEVFPSCWPLRCSLPSVFWKNTVPRGSTPGICLS